MVLFPVDTLFIGPDGEAVDPGRPGAPRHDARDWAYARQVSAQSDVRQRRCVCGASRARGECDPLGYDIDCTDSLTRGMMQDDPVELAEHLQEFWERNQRIVVKGKIIKRIGEA